MKHLEQAHKYIDNAKEILREKGQKKGKYYRNAKYVKIAGNTAYNGLLLALDSLLGAKRNGGNSMEWYMEELSKLDDKMLYSFTSAYETLHLSMGTGGHPSTNVVDDGLEEAVNIIHWVETKT